MDSFYEMLQEATSVTIDLTYGDCLYFRSEIKFIDALGNRLIFPEYNKFEDEGGKMSVEIYMGERILEFDESAMTFNETDSLFIIQEQDIDVEIRFQLA